jgi:pimeloyl-ACP methyl ester carboxylesterase
LPPTATPTKLTPTPQPTATATPEPTATPLPPTATPQPTATATPEPTPTPQPTPTNTPVISETPQSPARQQAGQLTLIDFWETFEPAGNYVIDVYRLRFRTVDRNERGTEVEAFLYVPQVDDPTNFPIFIYAPGTTGLSRACAPLNEWSSGRNWGTYHSYMLEYTAQGFIGLLPNYQGFDVDNLPHPYFVSEFQARALLDGGRAAFNFFEESPQVTARPMEAVVIAGYSSGGHAAFAAKDFAATYAPDLPLKGVIGHGPTTNIEVLFREDAVFSPYVVKSYRDHYGPEVVDPAQVFQDHWLANFEADVMNKCVDDIFDYYSSSARRMYRAEFLEALFDGRLQELVPEFQAALAANASGLVVEGVEIPVLLLQGTADQVVTPPSQLQFAASLCELGNHVNYISYPAVSHPNIRRASFRDTINWINSAANGSLPGSSCASLTNQ